MVYSGAILVRSFKLTLAHVTASRKSLLGLPLGRYDYHIPYLLSLELERVVASFIHCAHMTAVCNLWLLTNRLRNTHSITVGESPLQLMDFDERYSLLWLFIQ